MNTQYIAYYRVSTQQQGKSGLGLEGQQADVKRFTPSLLAEYTEIESGANNRRPQLDAAINHCTKTGATLIIAKLDRLSRNVAFIEALRSKGVKFVCCDMPEANEFVIGIMAQLAQFERKMISDRTKAALKAYKERGGKLGGSSADHCANMRASRIIKQAHPTIKYIIAAEKAKGQTFEQIAHTVNQHGFKTSRQLPFTATAVFRIYKTQV